MLGHQGQAESRPLAGRPLAGPCRRGRTARRGGRARSRGPRGRGPRRRPGWPSAGAGTPAIVPGWRSTRTRVTPPAYWAAFSTRLAITRSKRRLSTRRRSPSTPGPTSTGKSTGPRTPSSSDRRGGGDGPPDQLAGVDLVERELGRAGVEPGDLEEVVDHAGESLGGPRRAGRGHAGPGGRAGPGGSRAPTRWRSAW